MLSFFKKRKPEPEHVPFEINNIIAELPWHESRTWSKRGMAAIKKIVVHQSLTTYTKTTLSGINNYHIKPGPQNHISPNGAPHICYHYGIEGDGKVSHLNHLSSTVWHAKGQNTSSIGILVVGDFDGPTYTGKDVNPTEEQSDSLRKLLNYLMDYETLSLTPQDVYCHNDFGKENCPGNYLTEVVKTYKS